MKDNIWFTYKARIQAYKRLKWLDFNSQLLLVWYAVISSILGILVIRYTSILGHDTDILSAILSVILLGVSLTVTNLNFGIRANRLRDNYLKLQSLYQNIDEKPTTEQLHKYHEILEESENHNEMDDRIARVFARKLTSRNPTRSDKCIAYLWIIGKYIIALSLYLLPIAIVLFFYSRSV